MTSPLDRLTAQLRASGSVFAEEEAAVLLRHAPDDQRLQEWLDRRTAGEPLEHVVGAVSFRGLDVPVAPGVFIPRQRTVALVDHALALLQDRARPATTVVDLCCGSGVLGLVLLRAAECEVDLWSADVDPVAVELAARSLPAGRVGRGDLFEGVPDRLRGTVGLVLVNAPYVPTAEIERMPGEARLHEPRHTLDGGPDGLALHRRIAPEAARWLLPGGSLVTEVGVPQLAVATALYRAAGFDVETHLDDETGSTVLVGTLERSETE